MGQHLKKGYCHLYFGDGKGKTSILNGMVLRALGCDFEIKYYRFMKNWRTGELATFDKLGVEVADYYFSGTKFFWDMNDVEREAVKKEVIKGCEDLIKDASSGEFDMIFIDELFSCYDDQLIEMDTIINIIKAKHVTTELVFSAHEVSEDMFSYFDMISRIQKVKHYYETIKLLARKGIEF